MVETMLITELLLRRDRMVETMLITADNIFNKLAYLSSLWS